MRSMTRPMPNVRTCSLPRGRCFRAPRIPNSGAAARRLSSRARTSLLPTARPRPHCASLEPEDALGVLVEDLFHHLVRIAKLVPLAQDALVGHARIVAAEHDLVLQPAAHVDLWV